jgi:hypothetical protein
VELNHASRHLAITVIIYSKQTVIEMDYELETSAKSQSGLLHEHVYGSPH